MKKWTLYIGLNDQQERRQIIGTAAARRIAEDVFFEATGGATISEARGIYQHDDGSTVIENTLRVEVFGADEVKIRYAVDYLKKAFNQESIAVECAEVNSVFM